MFLSIGYPKVKYTNVKIVFGRFEFNHFLWNVYQLSLQVLNADIRLVNFQSLVKV